MHPDLAQMLVADRELDRKAGYSRPNASQSNRDNQPARRSRLTASLQAARSAVSGLFSPRPAERTAGFELR